MQCSLGLRPIGAAGERTWGSDTRLAVQVWSAVFHGAERRDVAVAHVVGQNENDVWLRGGLSARQVRCQGAEKDNDGEQGSHRNVDVKAELRFGIVRS